MKKSRDDSDILYYLYKNEGKVVTCAGPDSGEITSFLIDIPEQYIDKEKIALWT